MTRVDFYLLQGGGTGRKPRLACRVVDKAYRLGHRIYVYTSDLEEAARLDELLWTFAPNCFVPHAVFAPTGGRAPAAPVLIGAAAPPEGFSQVLVSLTAAVPDFFSHFERVADLVDNNEGERELARARYRFYRERGYPLEKHDIED